MLLIIFERHIVSRFHIHHHMRETRLKVLELEESLGNVYYCFSGPYIIVGEHSLVFLFWF